MEMFVYSEFYVLETNRMLSVLLYPCKSIHHLSPATIYILRYMRIDNPVCCVDKYPVACLSSSFEFHSNFAHIFGAFGGVLAGTSLSAHSFITNGWWAVFLRCVNDTIWIWVSMDSGERVVGVWNPFFSRFNISGN